MGANEVSLSNRERKRLVTANANFRREKLGILPLGWRPLISSVAKLPSPEDLGMELFLTVEQAAGRLQLRPDAVRRLLRSGSLQGVKRGQSWRVPESALITGELGSSRDERASRLAVALALIEQRDARIGPDPVRGTNSVLDIRALREERVP